MFLKMASSLPLEPCPCYSGILGADWGCLGAKDEAEPRGLNVLAPEEMHDRY